MQPLRPQIISQFGNIFCVHSLLQYSNQRHKGGDLPDIVQRPADPVIWINDLIAGRAQLETDHQLIIAEAADLPIDIHTAQPFQIVGSERSASPDHLVRVAEFFMVAKMGVNDPVASARLTPRGFPGSGPYAPGLPARSDSPGPRQLTYATVDGMSLTRNHTYGSASRAMKISRAAAYSQTFRMKRTAFSQACWRGTP